MIENVRLAKCKLLALGEAEETAKLLLFQEVNREHWLFENINKSAEIVLKYQSDLEFLENKKTDFSVSLSKIEAEILCLEEEKEINVSLEAEIESLEQSEADWKVKNTELEANLAIFRSQYEETSTPNLFSVEYNPDSSKIAEVEVLVAKEKKLVDQRYSSSIKGVTLREMEANLIEVKSFYYKTRS